MKGDELKTTTKGTLPKNSAGESKHYKNGTESSMLAHKSHK